MIFQEMKEKLEKRQFAEIDAKGYKEMLDDLYGTLSAVRFGEAIPQDYKDLREWVYTRVAKDIVYQDGSYLNEHFCIGVLYGILRSYDDQFGESEEWFRIYNMVVNKVI